MIVTIHQPEHMPWTGFFHKMSEADIYVLLDNVQFKKNNWQNRNRISDKNGEPMWLTIPVELKGHIDTTIKDIRINEQNNWRRKYWGRIADSYSKAPYYRPYADQIQEILSRGHVCLRDLNRDIIDFFRSVLGIRNNLVWASELEVTGKSTDLLVDIVKAVGGDRYLSGPDGANYLDIDKFSDAGIEVDFHDFKPPVYESCNGFIPGLSTLDVVMNHGESSANIIGIQGVD